MSDNATAPEASKIVWFEMPSKDTARAQAFYGSLLGWTFAPFEGMDYHMAYEGGGAVYNDPDSSGVTVYFGVADVDQSALRVTELGGVAGERQEIPGVGSYVQCEDVDGNKFGIYQEAAS